MITFPPEFVTTKFPGYFWNTRNETLYTIKVTGELRPLQYRPGNRWNHFQAGYQVSVKGRRRVLKLDYLKTLQSQEIKPVHS